MRLLTALLFFCVTTTPLSAAEGQDWYVVTTADGTFDYNAGDIDVSPKTGFKTLGIETKDANGFNSYIFTIDCRRKQGTFGGSIDSHETMTMVESNPDAMPPDSDGWEPISKDIPMKMAALAACKRHISGAVHFESAQAARAQLSILSN